MDLRNDPPTIVTEMENKSEIECINWIDENGDASIYTLIISSE